MLWDFQQTVLVIERTIFRKAEILRILLLLHYFHVCRVQTAVVVALVDKGGVSLSTRQLLSLCMYCCGWFSASRKSPLLPPLTGGQ